ncbi:hypothetical protein [Novosphingobium cyanobacteriorum]|uniref:Uncharacterized protein n=1 Tax=Novosphingobium cyanobacteriorum TaxID=3024215 RepID=A0ABT6CNS4_9SPHN|nr:hypothetical protein [Novosphingobium cyanobacteriorum]MDF8335561.1 hypothetical protein [Novosphingobium cyanobacteriorum]
MSRYSLKPLPHRGDVFEVAVGWDPALNTFFVIVFGVPDAVRELEVRMWRGKNLGEICTVEPLLAFAGQFAEIPSELAAKLERDRLIQPHCPAAPMSRLVAKILHFAPNGG